MRKKYRDSQKKSQVDKNTLDGRHRFPGIFQVITRFVEYLQPTKKLQPSEGDEYGNDGNEDVIHHHKKRGVGKTPRMIAFWSEISNEN